MQGYKSESSALNKMQNERLWIMVHSDSCKLFQTFGLQTANARGLVFLA